MTVTVRLFAAAAEAVGAHEVSLDVETVAELRAALGNAGNDVGAVIRQCAVLEDGLRLEDESQLAAGAVIDVMPPFAGG